MLKAVQARKQKRPALPTDPFESLYSQYINKVYQKCLMMTKDSEAAQDYTQDIFVKVFSKLDQFDNKSSLSTWLFSITHNYCLDQIRLSKRLPTQSMDYHLANEVQEEDTTTNSQEQLSLLNQLLKQLPSEEITLLKLKYEQEMSVAELSEYYQVSQSAMKMRLKRTRYKLASLYAEKYFD